MMSKYKDKAIPLVSVDHTGSNTSTYFRIYSHK